MPVRTLGQLKRAIAFSDRERTTFDRILSGVTDDEEDLEMLEAELNKFFAKKYGSRRSATRRRGQVSPKRTTAPKRKLSAWNKFVKANSKKKIFRFANGKLKLKKMGIAFRKTPAGRKR